jgi:hypothetical protein
MSTDEPFVRASKAAFERDGRILAGPLSLAVTRGGRATIAAPDEGSASLCARLIAGIAKATSGALYIGEYDPRIQPVQAKRLVGYVPRGGILDELEPPCAELDQRTLDDHADLWDIPRPLASAAARAVFARIAQPSPYTRALALALIRPVALLVLDQPPAGLETLIRERLDLQYAIVITAVVSAEPLREAVLAGRAT